MKPQISTTAIIGENATINDGAVIGASAVIGNHAVVGAGVRIGNRALVGAGTRIGMLSLIQERAIIGCWVRLGECVTVGEGVEIGNHAMIGGRAQINAGTIIGPGAQITEGAKIAGPYGCLVLAPHGPSQSPLTAYPHGETIWIHSGCFAGSIAEFLARHPHEINPATISFLQAYFRCNRTTTMTATPELARGCVS